MAAVSQWGSSCPPFVRNLIQNVMIYPYAYPVLRFLRLSLWACVWTVGCPSAQYDGETLTSVDYNLHAIFPGLMVSGKSEPCLASSVTLP